jgi:hypothetical protein
MTRYPVSLLRGGSFGNDLANRRGVFTSTPRPVVRFVRRPAVHALCLGLSALFAVLSVHRRRVIALFARFVLHEAAEGTGL